MNALRKEKPKRKSKPVRRARWPIVMLILAVGLVGARYITGYSLPAYPTYYEGPVIYPILVALQSPALFSVINLLLLLSFFGVAISYRGIYQILIAVGLIVFWCWVSCWTLISWTSLSNHTSHRAMTSYEGHVYTALEHHRFDPDNNTYYYFLYQCDSFGILCQLVPGETNSWQLSRAGYEVYGADDVSFHTGGIRNQFYLDIGGYISVIDEMGITDESISALQDVQPITLDSMPQVELLGAFIKEDGLHSPVFIPGTHKILSIDGTKNGETYWLNIYDLDNLMASPTRIQSPRLEINFHKDFSPVQLSADGSYLAVAFDDFIHIWDMATLTYERTLKGTARDDVQVLLFSDDNTKLFATYGRDMLVLWDLVEGTSQELSVPSNEAVYKYSRNGITDLVLSPDGQMLAGAVDTGIALWDVDTGRIIEHFPIEVPPSGSSSTLIFHPDGALLTMLRKADSWTLQTWRIEDWSQGTAPIALLDWLFLPTDYTEISDVYRTSDDQFILVRLYDLYWIDPINLRHSSRINTNHGVSGFAWYTRNISISSDNRYILTSHSNGVVQFWGVPDTTDQ